MLGTRPLRWVAVGAWLKRRVNGGPGKIPVLEAFQKSVLGVKPRPLVTAERFANQLTVQDDYYPDLRWRFRAPFFDHAPLPDIYCPTHPDELILSELGAPDSHGSHRRTPAADSKFCVPVRIQYAVALDQMVSLGVVLYSERPE